MVMLGHVIGRCGITWITYVPHAHAQFCAINFMYSKIVSRMQVIITLRVLGFAYLPVATVLQETC